jgi:flagellar basal-body rod protein FlgG
MQAQQINIDTIANNIANVNTTGFKQGRAEFQDPCSSVLEPVRLRPTVFIVRETSAKPAIPSTS